MGESSPCPGEEMPGMAVRSKAVGGDGPALSLQFLPPNSVFHGRAR